MGERDQWFSGVRETNDEIGVHGGVLRFKPTP